MAIDEAFDEPEMMSTDSTVKQKLLSFIESYISYARFSHHVHRPADGVGSRSSALCFPAGKNSSPPGLDLDSCEQTRERARYIKLFFY